ncbi:UDP-rhamnose/UDP-galactose transporter 1-like isoform X2 [Papaver somniferum]|uniref:UDP-rhamnose/UDP-galactose transporter 1-like isoform X2 n=1 Tax=Papaver somniferum TaxID=3469 RepID=UPI000E6FF5BA|nr:UDP-rhamnose/UDP-galactose transporter 1-like isoform X2 [Papaver somniferum]
MSTILDIKTGGITDNKYAFGILVFILLTKCADLSPNISAFEKLHFLICSALTSFGVIPMMTGIRYFNLTGPRIFDLKRICVLKSSDSLFLTSTSRLFASITSTSWHLLVTFCTLHVAQRFNVFKTKAIDTETVMLFGILNDVSTGLLDLCLGFNSIGFYQMTKLAIIPFTVLSETLFLDKHMIQ